MKKLFLGFAVLNFSLASLQAKPALPPLNESELLTVEHVCVLLIGKSWKQFPKLIQAVRPYAASQTDFENTPVICSAGCEYTVALRGGLWLNVGGSNIPPGQPEYSKKANAISSAAIYRGSTQSQEGYWNIRDDARPTIFAVEKNQDNDALFTVYAPPRDLLKHWLSPLPVAPERTTTGVSAHSSGHNAKVRR